MERFKAEDQMAGFMFQGKQGETEEEDWGGWKGMERAVVYSLDMTNFIFFTLLPGQSTLPVFSSMDSIFSKNYLRNLYLKSSCL